MLYGLGRWLGICMIEIFFELKYIEVRLVRKDDIRFYIRMGILYWLEMFMR